ncbi:MarR family winged helix-turn-helix transcriptional regulator [Paenibacillus cremeus]|uniref:MarR family transcriptional regulator n=1 Tax=Paenibacillus cremeus TaxID=2163881 RepID=A0A559K0R4_9BACL|nr:MarR family transcriptional regulator [Paenibacillus cremeus]TVY05667.1 MarR family transcriptional regulator [Paenibacillus cremeus]
MNERSFEVIELELAVMVRRLTAMSYAKKYELDRAAFLILHQISTQGPAGVKALSEDFRIDISTVSRQVAALIQKGYAQKVPDPLDKRAFFVEPTELGKTKLGEFRKAGSARLKEMTKEWTDEECRMFGQLLHKLNRAAADLDPSFKCE